MFGCVIWRSGSLTAGIVDGLLAVFAISISDLRYVQQLLCFFQSVILCPAGMWNGSPESLSVIL